MGCGCSKNAEGVTSPSASVPGNAASDSRNVATPRGVAGPPDARTPRAVASAPPRQPSQTPALKIWVSFEDTGRRTGFMLTGWDQDDVKTVEDMAKVLVQGHESRLHQLGFSGAALVLLDENGSVRPPRQKIEPSELISFSDMKTPLRVGMPPQWSSHVSQGAVLCSAASTTSESESSSEKMRLSPRSKAFRADIEAIAKRYPPKQESIYKADQSFPDVLKRDLHSHLKSSPSKQEPAQVQILEEEVKAIQKPKAVATQQQAVYQLDAARQKELAMQLVGFMSAYRNKDKQALLKDLKSFLEPESWAQLAREAALEGSAWSGQVLHRKLSMLLSLLHN